MVSGPRSSPQPPPWMQAAAAVRTLAVLLQAGAAPLSAWRHLADNDEPVAVRVLSRCDDGAALVPAIAAEGTVWGDVAAVWEVATTVGAPLAEVLRSLAETMSDAASAADDVRIALAEPASTARLLLWMPVGGLVLGMALGFDTIGIVVGNPVAAVSVGAGAALVWSARRWTRALLRRAEPTFQTPGLHAELVAVALTGGVSVPQALSLASCRSDEGRAAFATQRVLRLSQTAGVPAVELLRAEAEHERHTARIRGRLRAARLSGQLLVPLGVCTLPAFLLLGVVPLVLSVLSSTVLPL